METMEIEIVYAGVSSQALLYLQVDANLTAIEAIEASDILSLFPEIKLQNPSLEGRVGIFGQKVSLDTQLKNGDRVEIYRPLYQDPKEARKERAEAIAKQSRRNRQLKQESKKR